MGEWTKIIKFKVCFNANKNFYVEIAHRHRDGKTLQNRIRVLPDVRLNEKETSWFPIFIFLSQN